VKSLVRELGARGCKVDIFTRRTANQPRIVYVRPNVRVIHIEDGEPRLVDKRRVWGLIPKFVDGVHRFIEEENLFYNVIHCHHYHGGEVALQLRKKMGDTWLRVPIILTYHSLGSLEDNDGHRKKCELRLAAEVDCITASTEKDKNDIIQQCGSDPYKIRIIPCGVDLKTFCPRDPAIARKELGLPPLPHPIGVYVGRIDPNKNIGAIITSVSHLKARLTASGKQKMLPTILIVGGKPESEKSAWDKEQLDVEKMCHELGVANSFIFVGAKSHKELANYYNAATFHLLPSFYESFGMTALEALASGIPSIVTMKGGMANVINDGEDGYLIDPTDPVMLANVINKILFSNMVKMGEQARLRAMSYSWSAISQQVLGLYSNLSRSYNALQEAELPRRNTGKVVS